MLWKVLQSIENCKVVLFCLTETQLASIGRVLSLIFPMGHYQSERIHNWTLSELKGFVDTGLKKK